MDKPAYDVAIVGGGPAGMTAAIYCARKKLKVIMLTQDLGGQAAWSSDVENYLGFSMITGTELTKHFQDHLDEFKDEITLKLMNTGVQSLVKQGRSFHLEYNRGHVAVAKSVIIASGKRPRELGIPGERDFLHKGVTYCAWCDGPLFKGKTVAIIGGGNSALDAALSVQPLVKEIYIINNTSELTADEVMIEKATAAANIRIMNDARVLQVVGEKFVTGVKVHDGDTGLEKMLAVEGVFVEIGSVPATDYLQNVVELNDQAEVVIDARNMTTVPGIFAAGDVTNVIDKQIIIAAGEGAKAGIECSKWLATQP